MKKLEKTYVLINGACRNGLSGKYDYVYTKNSIGKYAWFLRERIETEGLPFKITRRNGKPEYTSCHH